MGTPNAELSDLLAVPVEARIQPMTRLAVELAAARVGGGSLDSALVAGVTAALVELLESGVGDTPERVALGDALGALGDPRLRRPDQDDYWALVAVDGYSLRVGRYLVTNYEWRLWVDGGGYQRDDVWTDEGRAWRDSGAERWTTLAADPAQKSLLSPNQPVVGVTWFEAMAYATTFGARLPERLERSQIVRGDGKRPYPWGEPFGTGRANTREEVVNRSTAVGLFRGDVTPDGVYDLAGNVGEWTLDGTGDKRVYHPGSWRQPSMAAWAKALAIRPPDSRGDDLGFRLVADLS